MDLAIVIPVFNETENIASLLEEIDVVPGLRSGCDIIVVDDGSNDDTAAVLEACRERYPRLQVLRHGACRGQSAAIVSGVRAAQRAWIATLDGDGQNEAKRKRGRRKHRRKTCPCERASYGSDRLHAVAFLPGTTLRKLL